MYRQLSIGFDSEGKGTQGGFDFTTSLDFSQYFDMRQGYINEANFVELSTDPFLNSVMTAINEVHEEVENVRQPIAEVALEHIHSQECVMVIGKRICYFVLSLLILL